MNYMLIEQTEFVDLIQCYYRTRDSDDEVILTRSDAIIDNIKEKYKEAYYEQKNECKGNIEKRV